MSTTTTEFKFNRTAFQYDRTSFCYNLLSNLIFIYFIFVYFIFMRFYLLSLSFNYTNLWKWADLETGEEKGGSVIALCLN